MSTLSPQPTEKEHNAIKPEVRNLYTMKHNLLVWNHLECIMIDKFVNIGGGLEYYIVGVMRSYSKWDRMVVENRKEMDGSKNTVY